jgi:hypothetical protein
MQQLAIYWLCWVKVIFKTCVPMLLAEQILNYQKIYEWIKQSISRSVVTHSYNQCYLQRYHSIYHFLVYINLYESYIISNIETQWSLFSTTHNFMKKNDSRCAVSCIINFSLHKTWSWLHALIHLLSRKELLVTH